MRTVIVLQQKLAKKFQQFLVRIPDFVCQPLLERANKTLRDSIRLWPVASDDNMNEFGIFGQLVKYISSKVYATIGNQELQIGW